MSSTVQPYVGPPTAAAIDRAIARAMDPETREAMAEEYGTATDRSASVDELIGKEGSIERGFVTAAGIIVGLLLLGRLFVSSGAWVGIAVPAAVLIATVALTLRRSVERPEGPALVRTKLRCLGSGVACAPLYTRLVRSSLSRTTQAMLWTSWAATGIGILAAITTMVG